MGNPLAELNAYELRHLCAHLEATGRITDLHRLLEIETDEGRNAWYDAKEASNDLGGYLADLERTRRVAESYPPPEGATAVGLQVQYALILTSIRAQAGQLPASLLAALVARKLWKPDHGLEYVRNIADPNLRSGALTQLAPYLPEELLESALLLAAAIEDPHERMWALAGLAASHPDPPAVWRQALSSAEQIEESVARAKALIGISLHMPRPLAKQAFQQGLKAAGEIRDQADYHWLLASLALELTSIQRGAESLECLRRIGSWTAAVARFTPAPLRFFLTLLALGTAENIDRPRAQAQALLELLPQVPEELPDGSENGTSDEGGQRRSRSSVFGVDEDKYILVDSRYRSAHGPVVKFVVPVLRYMENVPYASIRFVVGRVRSKLADVELYKHWGLHLPQNRGADGFMVSEDDLAILTRGKRQSEALGNEILTKDLFGAWVLRLSERGYPEEALAFSSLVGPAQVLTTLFVGNVKTEIMASMDGESVTPDIALYRLLRMILRGLTKRAYRELLLWGCALLPKNRKPVARALKAAAETRVPWEKAQAITRLAHHLSDSDLETAAEIIQALRSASHKAHAFADMSPHFNESRREEIISRALAAARQINQNSDLVRALMKLEPFLSAPVRRELVELSWRLADPWARAVALSSLGLHCPDPRANEELWHAVASLRSIEDAVTRLWSIARVAAYLPPAVIGEFIESVARVEDTGQRVRLLEALAPHLPSEYIDRAWAITRDVRPTEVRKQAAVAIDQRRAALVAERTGSIATKDDALDLFSEAGKIMDFAAQADAFTALAQARAFTDSPPLVDAALRRTCFAAALDAARQAKSPVTRLEKLAVLYPNIPREMAEETARLILAEEIYVIYERQSEILLLVPQLPDSLKREALQAVLKATLETAKKEELNPAIEALAPRVAALGEPELALTALQNVQRDQAGKNSLLGSSESLRKLVGVLSPGSRDEFVKLIENFYNRNEDTRRKVEIFAKLLPHAPHEWREKIVEECLQAAREPQNAHLHSWIMVTLSPWLPDSYTDEILSSIRDHRDSGSRVRLFTSLLTSLDEPLRSEVAEEAYGDACSLEDAELQARLLGELVIHMPSAEQESVMRKALAAAKAVGNPKRRAETLLQLLPRLPAAHFEEAYRSAFYMTLDSSLLPREHITLLLALRPHLNGTAHDDATNSIFKTLPLTDNYAYQYETYKTLKGFELALQAARKISHDEQRIELLADLSTQLGGRRKEEVITELLEAVQKLTDSDRRKLLEELPIQLLEKSDPVAALLIARTIGDTAQRAKTLMKIAPHLVQLPTDELYRLWKETLRVLGQRSRTDLLTDLHSLEVIFNVLEPGSVSHIAQSIRKIIRWW